MCSFHVCFGLLIGVVVCLQVGLIGTVSATTPISSSADVQTAVNNGSSSSTKPASTASSSVLLQNSSLMTSPEVLATNTSNFTTTATSSVVSQTSSFKTSKVLYTNTIDPSNSSGVSSTQNPSVPTAMTSKSENGTSSNTTENGTNESTTSVVPNQTPKQTPAKATDKTKAPGLQIVTSPKQLAYEGIQAVAGVCIVIASVLIIACVAFLAKFERHHEKLKKGDCFTGDGKQSNLTFTQSVGPVTVKTVKM